MVERFTRGRVASELRSLARRGDIRSSQQPLRGRPAEGLVPLQAVFDRSARAARVDGGNLIPGTGLPNPFDFGTSLENANARASRVFRNQLLSAGFDVTRPGSVGANGRGGSVSGSPGSLRSRAARAVLGLSDADRAVTAAIPGIPGMLAGLVGIAQTIGGPVPGVLGPVAPRVGTNAFRDTVSVARRPGLRGLATQVGLGVPGARPRGFFGSPFGGRGGGLGGGAGRGGGTQGGAGQGPNAR